MLLSAAAARADGHLLPPPDSVADQLSRIRKAVPTLLKRNLIAEAATTKTAQVWRDEHGARVGVVITDAGRTALGIVEPDPGREQEHEVAVAEATAPPPTKAALVLSLLRRDSGATLSELVAATGWLPHTTRAALTGLRKKGHVLAKSKRADVTCYRLAAGA